MDKLMSWTRGDESSSTAMPSSLPGGPTAAAVGTRPNDFRLGGNSTTVMSDYHIVRYDPLLGVLVCVGDDAEVLVLGRDTTRELLPIRKGTHWLDLFVFSGSTTFLVLAPEVLLCMDYAVQKDDSFLAFSGEPGTQFTCMHVPQGLTCGAVGRKDGRVRYFRLQSASDNPQDRPRIAWTTVEVDVLSMCQPYCKMVTVVVDRSQGSAGKFFSTGSVLSIDCYPDNPNAFIGVVAGVPGVCKWYVDESRLSCFFNATSILSQPDGHLAACKVTPGGVYVAATTMLSSQVLLWKESQRKSDRSCELYWLVDLTSGITSDDRLTATNYDSFWYNEYKVGIHMARVALEDSFRSTNDKHSQMYLLVHGQRDIMEVVIRLDEKQVAKKEQIVAHLNAFTAKAGVEAAKTRHAANPQLADTSADDYFKIFHVEPCALSDYWTRGLTDVDLEALFITSAGGLRPFLAKRNRQTGGIESIKELRELTAKTAWFPRAMLLRLPEPQIRELAKQAQQTPATSMWEKLLRGGDPLLAHALPPDASKDAAHTPTTTAGASTDVAEQLWRRTVMVTVTDAGQAMFLSPQSNEAFSVNPRAVQNCSPWTTIVAIGQDSAGLILEAALPSLDAAFQPSEIVLRVSVTESVLMVMKTDIRRSTCKLALDLDRSALQLDGPGQKGTRMVSSAVLVDARLEPSPVTSKMSVYKDGKSLLLLLEDSSVALVDLSGAKNDSGRPHMLLVPAGLLPVGARIASMDAFWSPSLVSGSAGGDFLCLACLFDDGKGFLLWNLSGMRMIAFSRLPCVAAAKRLCVAAAAVAPQPNLSGEVKCFEVRLAQSTPMAGGLEAGEYGEVQCRDPLGATAFTMFVGYGLAADKPGGGWCVRPAVAGAEDGGRWVALRDGTALPAGVAVKFQISGSTLDWSVRSLEMDGGDDDAVSLANGSQTLFATITNVKGSWGLGSAELLYDTVEGDMRSYMLNARATSAASGEAPSLAFISETEISLVDIGPFLRAATGSATGISAHASSVTVQPAVCRLDPARRWEQISMYRGRGAILVITSDANGWRWVSILDARTAQPRMQPYATLDFAGERHVQVLSLEIDNILHLYLLGETNGTIGHLFVEANLGTCKESGIVVRHCFTGRRFRPAPPSLRGYNRILPPAPSFKQETGFFKRLMTMPWEDIACKMESETLRNVLPSAVAPPATGAATKPVVVVPVHAPPPQQQQQQQFGKAAEERRELVGDKAAPAASAAAPGAPAAPAAVPGGRYAQLKAIAESQNVSLTEARRMMSENVRKLQERGEKLNEVHNKSEELAMQATNFEALCRQLKEKQRSSWLS